MRLAELTTSKVALIAAILAFISNALPWLFKWLGKRRLEVRRLTLETQRQDTDRLDTSYHRLESENLRLWGRVAELETSLTETRKRGDDLERLLRQRGIAGPDENGGAR